MKKYIMTIARISLFLSTQLTAMDRIPAAEGINRFKGFLASKLQSERRYFLGNQQIPNIDMDTLITWKQHINDMLKSYHVDRNAAKNIFIDMVMETAVQAAILRSPGVDPEQTRQLCYNANIYSLELAAYRIFLDDIFDR